METNHFMATRPKNFILAAALAGAAFTVTTVRADIPAINSGLLGSQGNGVHLTDTNFTLNDPLVAPGGVAAFYDAAFATGSRTEIPFLSQLNPAAGSPFTIELWVNPAFSTSDASPLFNRETDSPRSGWAFFQRVEGNAAGGWNFVMYNGTGTQRGWDLHGGVSTLNVWHHLVAVWDGATAKLYYNGFDTFAPNAPTGTVAYAPNPGPDPDDRLSLGRYGDGTNQTRFTGGIDEMAFYPSALTPDQILLHYQTATTNLTEGAYRSLVLSHGALEYLENSELVPEPGSVALLAGAGMLLAGRRRRGRA